jgi:predicted ATPase
VGHCRSTGQAIPYRPLLDVLRQLCGIAEGESTDAVTAALRRGLQESGRVGEEEVALLCQILDLPGASEPLTRLSPEVRQSRTFALLRHLILHAAQRQPIVLLQCAAVVGTEVPLTLLQAIAELSDEALLLGLARLQAAEFLYETHRNTETVCTFKHALTQQVAYETLLQERRRAFHAHIVEALEALAKEGVVEQVERLAEWLCAMCSFHRVIMGVSRPICARPKPSQPPWMIRVASHRSRSFCQTISMALSTAIGSYRTMEMTWWLAHAELALAQVKG